MSKKMAIFVSGTGSIMEAIIAARLPVGLVLADRACKALRTAAQKEIPTELESRITCLDHEHKFNREIFTRRIGRQLIRYDIDLVMMAGFMTILHESIFKKYRGAIINTHPSLLPAFKGDHAVADTLRAGVKITGCTMHYATEVLDEGLIIDQRAVRVQSGDTVETLHERIKVEERKMVTENLRRLLAE